MISCFLSNISAKYYKNPSMLSRVIAKNVGDVFFETQCIHSLTWSTAAVGLHIAIVNGAVSSADCWILDIKWTRPATTAGEQQSKRPRCGAE